MAFTHEVHTQKSLKWGKVHVKNCARAIFSSAGRAKLGRADGRVRSVYRQVRPLLDTPDTPAKNVTLKPLQKIETFSGLDSTTLF